MQLTYSCKEACLAKWVWSRECYEAGAVRELADFLYGLGEIWQRVSEIYKNYLLNSPVFCETFYLSPDWKICYYKEKHLYFNILISISKSSGSVLNFYGSYQRKEISMLLSQIKQQRGFFSTGYAPVKKTFCAGFKKRRSYYGTD